MSSIFDRKEAVRVTNATETPYLIKRNTQMAEFSVVTPEKAKFIKPLDMAILSMIPEGDPDLTAYLNELHRTNKPEQQINTFWFPTPQNPGKIEDFTNTNPQTTVWSERERQIESKRWYKNPKENSWRTWLDRYTADR